MNQGLIITIDGPSGVGKGTVAKSVAKELALAYLDTGAMYRAVALQVKRNPINIDNDTELLSLLNNTEIGIVNNQDNVLVITLNNEDITDKIRSPEISRISSDVATKRLVRKKLVELQREIGLNGNIVVEGRDMGTYVFPEATFKFYLDATLEERALRRRKQLMENNINIDLDNMTKEIELRDKQDKGRLESPLHPAPNAVIIDTTNLNADEVTNRIITEVKVSK
ncbi:MAG: (d)CMP kinase [Thermodesulfobacteriales bacterium]|jgi:cytidylate kinase|nr:MAG: (d)CMP kinase [Thermodesulfobacteriales bacterium]